MVAEPLLAWFSRHARPLPWRREPREAYGVWVSEVMLQQTRVETVLRYYDRFLERFPTVAALAAAEEDALMKAWEGLGYYRRARLLREGARAIVERHGGELPRDVAALRALPGFGPYTAGAVGSLAFGLRGAAVDGNVLRVWSRLSASADDVGGSPARAKAEAWVLAHQPRASPGAFNEALMELGATVCVPRAPRCGECPLRASCRAFARGEVERFPVKAKKAAAPVVRVALGLARQGELLLLEKRDAGLLAGTWGLPWVEVGAGEDARAVLAGHVAALVGGRVEVAEGLIGHATHVFTHRRWEMECYAVAPEGPGGEWRDPSHVALATAHRRLLSTIPSGEAQEEKTGARRAPSRAERAA